MPKIGKTKATMFESQEATDARVYAQTLQDCKNFIAISGVEGAMDFVAQRLTVEDIKSIIYHYGVPLFEQNFMNAEGEMPMKVAHLIMMYALRA